MDWRILCYHCYWIWTFRAQCFTMTTQYSNTSYCAILQFASTRHCRIFGISGSTVTCKQSNGFVREDYVEWKFDEDAIWRHGIWSILVPIRAVAFDLILKMPFAKCLLHNGDVIMGAMASQINSFAIVYSTVYWGANQRKYQSCPSLAFVLGFTGHSSLHKCPVTRKNTSIWWRHHDSFLALNSFRSPDVFMRH